MWLAWPIFVGSLAVNPSDSRGADPGPRFLLTVEQLTATAPATYLGFAALVLDALHLVRTLHALGIPGWALCHACSGVKARGKKQSAFELAVVHQPRSVPAALKQGITLRVNTSPLAVHIPYSHIRAVSLARRWEAGVLVTSLSACAAPLATIAWATEATTPRPLTYILLALALARSLTSPFVPMMAGWLLQAAAIACAHVVSVAWHARCRRSAKVAPVLVDKGVGSTPRTENAGSGDSAPGSQPGPTTTVAARAVRAAKLSALESQLAYAPISAFFSFKAKRTAFLWCLIGCVCSICAAVLIVVCLIFGSIIGGTQSLLVQLLTSVWFLIGVVSMPLLSALIGYIHGACLAMPSSTTFCTLGLHGAIKLYIAMPIHSEAANCGAFSPFWACGEGRIGRRAPVAGNCVGFMTPLIDSFSQFCGCAPSASRHFRLSPLPSREQVIIITLPAAPDAIHHVPDQLRALLDPKNIAPVPRPAFFGEEDTPIKRDAASIMPLALAQAVASTAGSPGLGAHGPAHSLL